MATSKELPPMDVPFFPKVFLKNQFCTKPQRPAKTTDLSGKVAIITGSNTGLGYEAATQMLDLKLSHLIMAVRSSVKGEAAAVKLRAKYPTATIDVMLLDMSSYSSIQDLARRVDSQLPRLDYAILNAGLFTFKYQKLSTGHETHIQINFLSTVLLATLLLPILKRKSTPGTPGRLTIVHAALSLVVPLDSIVKGQKNLLAAMDDEKNFVADKQYNLSKVLAQMWAYKMVDYVSADDVIVNLVCPGYVKGTSLGRDIHFLLRPIGELFGATFGRNVRDGASTYLDANFVKGKESHGSFLMSWTVTPYNSFLYTPEGRSAIDKLWQETMSELEFAGVSGILESMQKV